MPTVLFGHAEVFRQDNSLRITNVPDLRKINSGLMTNYRITLNHSHNRQMKSAILPGSRVIGIKNPPERGIFIRGAFFDCLTVLGNADFGLFGVPKSPGDALL